MHSVFAFFVGIVCGAVFGFMIAAIMSSNKKNPRQFPDEGSYLDTPEDMR